MFRTVHAHLNLPQDTARRLDRLRRRTHQPLARFITTILADFLEDARATRPSRRAHPSRRRAA